MQKPTRTGPFLYSLCLLCACATGTIADSPGAADAVRGERQSLISFQAPLGAKPDALVKGSDGLWYGAAAEGGKFGHGAVFVITHEGALEDFYSFSGGPDCSAPSALVAGSDAAGALYGLCTLSAASAVTPTLGIFKLTSAGNFQVLQQLDGADDASLLVAAEDGGVYGSAGRRGTVFHVAPGGELRTLYAFDRGRWANTLSSDGRGAVYGTTPADGNTTSEIFRLTAAGEFSKLASLAAASGSTPAESATALARGRDGSVYVAVRQSERALLYRQRGDQPLQRLAELAGPVTTLVAGDQGQVFGIAASNLFSLAADGGMSSLHEFASEQQGSIPNTLALGDDGVYGTAVGAGGGFGTVFRVAADGGFSTLHEFNYPDGVGPSSLVRGAGDSLYGTTQAGGANGFGTVFKATPDGKIENLHAFAKTDGATPQSLTVGHDGILYGRTLTGGAADLGTLFSLTPDGTFTTLVSFTQTGQSEGPALVQTADGTLYGADQGGSGHIFRLTHDGAIEIIYSFPGLSSRDGAAPSSLVVGRDGALYGTTAGAFGPTIPTSFSSGTLFRITTDGTFSTLYAFAEGDNRLGASPHALIAGRDGMLYGATANIAYLCGVYGGLFKLDPSAAVQPELVYGFTGKADGTGPTNLMQSRSGAIFGLTVGGMGLFDDEGGSSACKPRNASVFSFSEDGLTTLQLLPLSIADGAHGADLDHAAALVEGADGRVFGVIADGGTAGSGELFALAP